MARDHARIHLDIWGDDDWLDLPGDAQLLYLTLYTSPNRTLCGALDWAPKKFAQRAADWTVARVEAAAEVLSRRLFLIIDTDTDECLLRSWIKHDGLWRTPNMAVSVANARTDLASRTLRGVVVHEVLKLRAAEPESTSWQRPAVQSMLTQKPVNPAELEPFKGAPNGYPNGTDNPTRNGDAKGSDNQNLTHGVNPTSNGGPTNAIPIANATERTPHPVTYEPSPERAPARRTGAEVARSRFEMVPSESSQLAKRIVHAYSDSLDTPIDAKTGREIATVIDRCVQAGQSPEAITAGVDLWAKSDSFAPSQIPKYVTKAAATRKRNGVGKPTLKAAETQQLAEEIIAEMGQP